ncbi:hypothetical protein M3Y95_01272700 [Aphelenchoides besseyi]|nr:hypothetical protein M3Y95_01272700 [Aphelenchoides besseyi]
MKLVFLFMLALGLDVEANERSKYVVVKQTKWLPLQYRPYLTVDEEKGGVNVLLGSNNLPQEVFVPLHASGNQKQEIYMEWNVSSCSDYNHYYVFLPNYTANINVAFKNKFELKVEGNSFGYNNNPYRFKFNSAGHVNVLDKTNVILSSYNIQDQKEKSAFAKFFEDLHRSVKDVNKTNLPGLTFVDFYQKCKVTVRIFLDTENKNEQLFPLVERPAPPFGHKVSAIRYKTEAEIDAECLVVVICTVTFTSLAMIIIGTWMYLDHQRVLREIMNR